MKKKIKILVCFIVGILTFEGFAQDYTISLLPFNSDTYDEFSPIYYKGDVVFCSNKKNDLWFNHTDDKNNMPLLDIFWVEDKGKEGWGKPILFSDQLKTPYYEGPATFNGRGNEIYFSRNLDVEKRFKNSMPKDNKLGIFYSKYTRRYDSWSEPTPFEYNNEEYNVAHPSLSEDDKYLYFVSDMKGGYGGTDIYVCEKENGTWGEPKNLGPNINTSGNEYFPFIHSTGRLYFSSDGHGGMGRLDIFYSEKVIDEWHKPIAMDSPINSRYNDFGLIIDAFKKTGMFSSDRQRSSDDIYSFSPLYPMFDNSERQVTNDYCYLLYEAGAENPDSSMFDFEWNFGDGKRARGLEVEHCFNGPGDFTVELNVIDKVTGDMYFTQASHQLKIEDVKQVFINAPDTVQVGEEVHFDGYQTNIEDFKISKYYWDFGDGRKTRGVEARHIYTARGTYIVQLGVVSKKDRKTGETQRRGVYRNIEVVGQGKSRRR